MNKIIRSVSFSVYFRTLAFFGNFHTCLFFGFEILDSLFPLAFGFRLSPAENLEKDKRRRDERRRRGSDRNELRVLEFSGRYIYGNCVRALRERDALRGWAAHQIRKFVRCVACARLRIVAEDEEFGRGDAHWERGGSELGCLVAHVNWHGNVHFDWCSVTKKKG